MIRWKPQVSIPSDLQSLRLAHAALRREWEAVKREYYARKAGFDPNQPRVPAGSSEGGQWTDAGGDNTTPSTFTDARNSRGTPGMRDASSESGESVRSEAYRDLPIILAAGRKPSQAYCWNQLHIDSLLCNSLSPGRLQWACRSQAMERYSACISGKPLPPLPF